MADWPIWAGGPPVVSAITQMEQPGSSDSHTKGAWAELTPSLPSPLTAMGVTFPDWDLSPTRWLFDVGIGPVGSEEVVLANVVTGHTWGSSGRASLHMGLIPIAAPAGARLAIRAQGDATGTNTVDVQTTLLLAHPRQWVGHQRSESFGANEATSEGHSLTTAWGELGILTRPAKVVYISLRPHPDDDGTNDVWGYFDLGIGPSGSEVPLIPDIAWGQGFSNAWSIHYGANFPIPVNLPAGTRLSARGSFEVSDATNVLPMLTAHTFG